MNNRRNANQRGQSSLELLITVAFGLVILLPIVVLALVQISASSSNLAVSEAQAAATKLAEASVTIGSQGYPAKELVLIQVPQGVTSIIVGKTGNVGHAITFVVNTNAGSSDAVAYTPVNVTGSLQSAVLEGTYLVNVSAESNCYSISTSLPQIPCVSITPS